MKEISLVVVGGVMSLVGVVISHYLERINKKRDLISSNARERLENLYIPLIDHIEKATLPDEFHLDEKELNWIKDKIYDNRLYASPRLMEQIYFMESLFFEEYHQGGFYNGTEAKAFREIDWTIYTIISQDYNKLMNIAGLGRIGKAWEVKRYINRFKVFCHEKMRRLKKRLRKLLKGEEFPI